MKYDPIKRILVEENNSTKTTDAKDSALSDVYANIKKYYPEVEIKVSSFSRYGKSAKTVSLTNIEKNKIDKIKNLVIHNIKKNNGEVIGVPSVTSSSIGIVFAENSKAKDSKTKDLEKPYFDPLYKDTRRAIVKEVQNYLSSKGYNNSVGKYDKVVYGVRSLLEKTLLQPGTEKFNNAVHQEADRLLKKYNLTKDSNFDDAVKKYFDKFKGKSKFEVEKIVAKAKGNPAAEEAYKKYLKSIGTKDAKTKDSEFDRLNNYVNSLGNELGSDWLKLNGKAVHPDYAKREVLSIKKSIPSKVSSNDLTKEEAKKLSQSINQVLKNIEEIKRKYTGYDSKTKDAFNRVDLKSIFGGTDRRWLVAKKDIKNSLAKANAVQELEKMYDNMSYTDYSDIIDDYNDIWNEVGKYAQDKRRQCINELSELRSEVFKKLSKLDKESK